MPTTCMTALSDDPVSPEMTNCGQNNTTYLIRAAMLNPKNDVISPYKALYRHTPLAISPNTTLPGTIHPYSDHPLSQVGSGRPRAAAAGDAPSLGSAAWAETSGKSVGHLLDLGTRLGTFYPPAEGPGNPTPAVSALLDGAVHALQTVKQDPPAPWYDANKSCVLAGDVSGYRDIGAAGACFFVFLFFCLTDCVVHQLIVARRWGPKAGGSVINASVRSL